MLYTCCFCACSPAPSDLALLAQTTPIIFSTLVLLNSWSSFGRAGEELCSHSWYFCQYLILSVGLCHFPNGLSFGIKGEGESFPDSVFHGNILSLRLFAQKSPAASKGTETWGKHQVEKGNIGIMGKHWLIQYKDVKYHSPVNLIR